MGRRQKQRIAEIAALFVILAAVVFYGCNKVQPVLQARAEAQPGPGDAAMTAPTAAAAPGANPIGRQQFGSLTELDLSIENGTVRIEQAAAGSQPTARWEITPSDSPHAAPADSLSVEAREENGVLRFEDRYHGPLTQDRPHIELTLSVPAGIPIDATLGNGKLSIAASGPLTTNLGNGDLHLSGSFTGCEAHLGNGTLSIAAQLTGGKQHFDVGNGNLMLKLLDGSSAKYRAVTGIGVINLGGLPGKVTQNMMNQTAEGTLDAGAAQIELTVGAGGIELSGS